MYRILIYGEDNLKQFKNKIGFLHPDKKKKLDNCLRDYVKYDWDFPEDKKKCQKFVKKLLKEKIRIKKPYYVRIFTKKENNLKRLQKLLKKFYNLYSLVDERKNGTGTIFYEMSINRKEEIKKLIKKKLIPNLFKLKKA